MGSSRSVESTTPGQLREGGRGRESASCNFTIFPLCSCKKCLVLVYYRFDRNEMVFLMKRDAAKTNKV